MRRHRLLDWPAPRVASASLVMTLWAGAAAAYDWDLSYKQNQDVAVPLQPVTDAPPDATCPEHTRLVQVSTEIDLAKIGTLTIEPNLPEVRRTGLRDHQDRSYIDQQASLSMDVDLFGCQFRQHFLPLNGEFIISGDFDVGRPEDIATVVVSNERYFTPLVDYRTHWTGLVHGISQNEAVTIPGLSQDQIMGTLMLRFSYLDMPLTSDDRPDARANFNRLEVNIVLTSN